MSESGRNIIVLFDGTAARQNDNTNIVRMLDCVPDTERDSTCFYYPGTDTVSGSEDTQKVVSTEIIRDVKNAYETVNRLRPTINDRIYIFGYSRGAISARTLAQSISNPVYYKALRQGHTLTERDILNSPVEVLGVFDPVFGKMNPLTRAPKHEIAVSKNPKVKSYIEIVACDEHRFVFAHRSSAPTFIKELLGVKKDATPKTIQNQKTSYYLSRLESISKNIPEDFSLKDTRYFIAMRGGHADIGNQTGDEVLGNHALLTMSALAIYCSPDLKSSFKKRALEGAMNFIASSDVPKPNSSLNSWQRGRRVMAGLGKEFLRRKKLVKNEIFIHHAINTECSGSNNISTFNPDYKKVLS